MHSPRYFSTKTFDCFRLSILGLSFSRRVGTLAEATNWTRV